MNDKEKIELEFTINSSTKSLFFKISDPSGLDKWFADRVEQHGNQIDFYWSDSLLKTTITQFREDELIRFVPTEDNENKNYLEFKITRDELTDEVALIITDFVEKEEKESMIEVWENQVSILRKILGV